MAKEHIYEATVVWTGNTGVGTRDPRAYDRTHEIKMEGKPNIPASADTSFKGEPTRWNPEELLMASLSSCHMLWYLYLCSAKGIVVTEYVDRIVGQLEIDASGIGKFKSATLHPTVTIANEQRIDEAKSLHRDAHQKCFVANSINFSVAVEPKIVTKGGS